MAEMVQIGWSKVCYGRPLAHNVHINLFFYFSCDKHIILTCASPYVNIKAYRWFTQKLNFLFVISSRSLLVFFFCVILLFFFLLFNVKIYISFPIGHLVYLAHVYSETYSIIVVYGESHSLQCIINISIYTYCSSFLALDVRVMHRV